MTNRITMMTATLAMTIAAGAPLALAQSGTTPDRQPPDRQPTEKDATKDMSQKLHFVLSEEVIGATLKGQSGDTAGSVDDVIVSAKDGALKYYVISVGGVLGLGDKLIAVPTDQIRWDSRADNFVLAMPATRLETMPAFEASKWTDLERKDWEKALVDHESGYKDSNRNDDPADRNNPDDDQPGADKDHMGKTLIRLSDITGTNIKAGNVVTDDDRNVTLESDREKVGEIDGAIIEITTAKVPFVIISTGGILGFGEDDRIVPWQAMTMQGDDLMLKGITADQFKSLEPVKKADIDTYDSADDVADWYQPFGVRPDQFKPGTDKPKPSGG
jgi:sporulation protein YlmC with PRC-barrel domain